MTLTPTPPLKNTDAITNYLPKAFAARKPGKIPKLRESDRVFLVPITFEIVYFFFQEKK
jgi:hypothetical protein